MSARLYRRKKKSGVGFASTWWCALKVPAGRARDGAALFAWVRQSTGQRDRRAAERVAAQLERGYAEPPAARTTLPEAFEQLFEACRVRGRADGTIGMYSRCARHLLRLLGAERPLADLDAAAVDDYISARVDEGASRHTIGKELTTLRRTLKIARRRGQFPRSLDEVMPEQWSTGYKPRERALTQEEAGKLLGALRPHRAAHVAFILATGARWGESTRARREDVDLAGRRVYLRGTKTELARRTVPIVAFAGELLGRALSGAEDAGQLFRPWSNVRHDLARACVRAGIAPVTPNDLRRTCSTWLRGAGVPPDLVGAFLGHADSRMVERVYGRLPTDVLGELFRVHLGEAA